MDSLGASTSGNKQAHPPQWIKPQQSQVKQQRQIKGVTSATNSSKTKRQSMGLSGVTVNTHGSAMMNDLTSMGFTTTAKSGSYSSKAANQMMGRQSAKAGKYGKAGSNDQIISGEMSESLARKTNVVSASGGSQVFYPKAMMDGV